MNDNLYDILGVNKNATQEEIEKAYKSKARQHHPDRFTKKEDQDAATIKFQSISEAYRTLSNSEKRRIYDATGTKDGAGGSGSDSGGFNSGGFGGGNYQFYGFDFGQGFGGGSNSFENGFDINDIFNMFSGGGRRQAVNKYTLEITIEEAFIGGKKQVMITENTPCSKCTGMRNAYCSTCKGSRHVKTNKQQEINIPSGVKNGDAIALNNTTHIVFNIKSNIYNIDGVNLTMNVEMNDVDFKTNKPLNMTDLNGNIYTIDISKYKIATAVIIVANKGLWTDTRKVSRGTLTINLSVKFNK